MNKLSTLVKRKESKKPVKSSNQEGLMWARIALEQQKIIHAKKRT